MKLAFIAPGTSVRTAQRLGWFADNGHQVHLITLPHSQPPRAFHPSVKVHELHSGWIVPRVNHTVDILMRVQPDLVEGQFIAWLACAMLRNPPPLILWADSDILKHKWWAKKALRKADMVLCDLGMVQAGLEKLGTDMSKVKMVCSMEQVEMCYKELTQGSR